jgi:hypothetical protein
MMTGSSSPTNGSKPFWVHSQQRQQQQWQPLLQPK